MAPFLRKRPAPAQRSPERAALAECVEKVAAARERVAAVAKAQGIAEDAWRAARQASELADTALEGAKAAITEHVIATAMGNAGEPPLSVRDARTAAQNAKDDLEIAAAASEELGRQRFAAEQSLGWAKHILSDRIADVVKADGGVEKLADEFKTLQVELANRRAALDWLSGKQMIPDSHRLWRSEPEHDVRIDTSGALPWQAASAALETDPDAPLPDCAAQGT
jgi:hypothetical protein